MKKILVTLVLLFATGLFFSCTPDMTTSFSGSWVYTNGTSSYKYTFTEKTFKCEVGNGSSYVEEGNGTFSATGDRLIFDWDKQYDEAGIITSYREIETTYGISNTEILFNEGPSNNFIIVGGNTETLIGKWKMYISYKDVYGGFKAYLKYYFDIDFDFKSDGTFVISRTLPEESVLGKWVIDGDKLTFSEMVFSPGTNNSLASIFQEGDYTFKVVGNAVGFVQGYGSGQTIRTFAKEID